MNRISIDNLFPSARDHRPLDVKSLFGAKEQEVQNKINLNIDRLINLREDRKKKIMLQYDKLYNTCLSKINEANNLKKTSFIHTIPEGVYGSSEYDTKECLNYIVEKLDNMYFDTMVLSNKSVYISWVNMAKNMEDAKRREQEKSDREKEEKRSHDDDSE